MKKAFSLLAIFVLCFSCTINKKPEFLGIEKIDLEQASIDSITIRADAVFSHENDLGGTLLTDEIEVFIDDSYIATVSSEAFEVPPQDTFTVPLRVNFPSSEIFNENNGGLLGAIIKQVLNKKIEVNFKGDITYKLAGFSFDYPIDHTEEIHIE